MNTDDFANFLKQKGKEMKAYAHDVFPDKAGEISLRFIDKNFQDQGWHGQVFQPWKPNKKGTTILVKNGHLRAGNSFTTSDGITHVQNNVKYAAVHNNGFHGPVQIAAHTRRKLISTKQPTGRTFKTGRKQINTIHGVSSTINVRAHTRIMNIPKRQFFPMRYDDSPVLVKEMQTEIYNHILNKTFKR